MKWSDEHKARLKELRGQGWSYSQVADALNKSFGTELTRCAVGGMVDRLIHGKNRDSGRAERGHNLRHIVRRHRPSAPVVQRVKHSHQNVQNINRSRTAPPMVKSPVKDVPLPPDCAPNMKGYYPKKPLVRSPEQINAMRFSAITGALT